MHRKYTLTQVAEVLYLASTRAKNKKGVQLSMPNAQVKGSARGLIFLYLLAISVPKATPIKPAATVIPPNINATLLISKQYDCLALFG